MRGKVTTNRFGAMWRQTAFVPLGMALLATLGLTGCGVPDYLTGDTAAVNVFITGLNGGVPLLSDVRVDGTPGTVASDQVVISIAVRHKNLRIDTPLIPSAVFIERYEIRYVRSDGRAVEGEDVPFRITGSATWPIDVADSGSSEFTLEVVRAQAKLEPPLMNLRAPENGDPSQPEEGGGAIVLTVFADVTLHGRTVSGDAIEASGRMQIDFADWEG